MIEVRELTKRFGEVTAVEGVSFRLDPGSVTGFIGPNGAGKSTTMRMMVGLDRPTSGTCLVDGKPYGQLSAPLRVVGSLIDPEAPHGGRSARNHLRVLARTHGIPDRRVDEVLDSVGLADAANRRIRGFSLGMRQRLGLAGALLGDPAVLLLDEPANGLDPDGIIWIRTLLRSLAAEGRTVLVSSHLMSELAQTADRLIVLGRGRVLADDSVEALTSRYGTRLSRVRPDRPADLETLLGRQDAVVTRLPDGILEVTGVEPADIAMLAQRHGILLLENSTVTASLEEAYLTLTRDHTRHIAKVTR
ncbi:ABC transporter ATP-binding protein [Actinoplanes sp. NBRC 103695]|uniref:ABC transporter ATP-binding protein n=1 Tax=Actinoplanes sp. NBRC 103695 TaxID=3032202 RepID=UPI0024A21CBC|nr:ABC transporter ATP-binding protein [Actinoplanes sp. NBRC 103695]GLY97257.1 multidrug ABC transporter ATP-binding protein [Actinoplanes sp. NBRC 103695]